MLKKIIANIITFFTELAHFILSVFVSEEKLLEWKPIHLCWWFKKNGFEIPKYFIAGWDPPTVTTQACDNETGDSVDGHGNITALGDGTPTTRGFCYIEGTSGDPTTADSTESENGTFGTGAYTLTISPLSPSTSYRVRAYAINNKGTGYGATVQTATTAPVDRNVNVSDSVVVTESVDADITGGTPADLEVNVSDSVVVTDTPYVYGFYKGGIFYENFETGDLGKFDSTAITNDTFVIDSGSEVQGTYSWAWSNATGSGNGYHKKNLPSSSQRLFFQFKIKYSVGWDWNAGTYHGLMRYRNAADDSDLFRLNVEDNGANNREISVFDGGFAYTGIQLTEGINTVELELFIHGSSGYIKVWHNNNDYSNPDYDSGLRDTDQGENLQRFDFGNGWSDGSKTGTAWFDDVKIDDEFIGDRDFIQVSESVVVTESVDVSIQSGPPADLNINVSDPVVVTDSPTVSIQPTATLTINVSDPVVVTDTPTAPAIQAAATRSINVSDSVVVTDTLTNINLQEPDLEVVVTTGGSEAANITQDAGSQSVGFGDNERLYAMQSFHPSVNTITAISFEITSVPSSADINVYLDESSSDEPVNTLITGALYDFTIDNGDIEAGPGMTKYSLPVPLSVTADAEYCFYLEFSSSEYKDFVSSTTNPYSSGMRRHYNNGTAEWDTPDSGNLDFNFIIWGYDAEGEKVVVTESVSVSLPAEPDRNVNVSDSVVVTESVSVGDVPSGINVSDPVVVTDTPSVSIQAAATLEINVSDSVVVTDSPAVTKALNLSVSDSVVVTEAVVVRKAAATAVVDDFSDNSLDTSIWNNWGAPELTEESQHIEIDTTTSAEYQGMDSTNTDLFTLSGSQVSIRIEDAGDQSITSYELYPLQLLKDANNALKWYINQGTLRTYKEVATVQTEVGTGVSYSASTHRYLRIRESGGTVYFDHSADGTNWTNHGSELVSNLFDLNNFYIEISNGTWAAEGTTTTSILDDVNVFSRQTDVSDSVVVTESVDVTIQVEGEHNVNVSDPVVVTESVSIGDVPNLSVSDSVVVTESVNVSIQPVATRTLSVSDSVVVTESFSKVLDPLFYDGFETGDWSVWEGTETGSGALTDETSIVYEGSHSSKSTISAGSGYARFYNWTYSENTIYARGYFYFPSGFSVDSGSWVTIMMFSHDQAPNTWFLSLYATVNDKLQFKNVHADTYSDESSIVIPKGQWVSIEVKVTVHPSAGEARLWIDGSEVITFTGQDLEVNTGDNNRGVVAGIVESGGAQTPANATLYADAFFIDDEYIGPDLVVYHPYVTDSVVVTESVNVSVQEVTPLSVNVSDSVVVTESVNLSLVSIGDLNINVSDPVVVTESVSVGDVPNINTSQPVVVTESTTIALVSPGTPAITVADPVVVTDSPTVSLQPVPTLTINVSDSVVVTESVQNYIEPPPLSVNVSDSVVVTESVTTDLRAAWYNPDLLVINTGSVDSGDIEDTWSDNNVNLVLNETTGTPGFDYEFHFYNVKTADIESILVRGYYDGNVAHDVKIYQYNFTLTNWTALTPDDKDFPDETSEQAYTFTISTGADYVDSGEMRFQISHDSAGNITHQLHIDEMKLIEDLSINIHEPVVVTESTSTTTSAPQINVSDSVVVTESVNVSIQAVATRTINVSDSVVVTESVSNAVSSPQINVSDSVVVTESVSAVVTEGLVINVSETVVVTDSIPYSDNEPVVVTESVNTALGVPFNTINVTDSVVVTESVSIGDVPNPSVTESVVVTESVQLRVSAPQISVSDNVVVTDSVIDINAFETLHVVASDSVVVTESVDIDLLSIKVSDTVIVSESVVAAVSAPPVGVSDTVYVSESVGIARAIDGGDWTWESGPGGIWTNEEEPSSTWTNESEPSTTWTEE